MKCDPIRSAFVWPVESRSEQSRTPAYRRPALEHRAHGGSVRFRETERHGRVVNGSRRREQWCRTVELARELGDDLHVLLPDADLHGRVAIVVASHHRSASMQMALRYVTTAHTHDLRSSAHTCYRLHQ